jgi:enhancing lycopene biosynthesis protein 2
MKKNIAIILSGCGVYDGSEIHETVCLMLAMEENQLDYQFFAPNMDQYHVINHLTSASTESKRNVLEESARIARGNIKPLDQIDINQFDGIALPGGFGAAKNLSTWAIDGENMSVNNQVYDLLLDCLTIKKPILSLCISPMILAKIANHNQMNLVLSLGNTKETSPYPIAEIHKSIVNMGNTALESNSNQITIDPKYAIVTAPCYMMDVSLLELKHNIDSALEAFVKLLR